MTKFYGHGQVWDKANRKVLCKFEKNLRGDTKQLGVFCTDEARTIEILKDKGYAFEEMPEEVNTEVEEIPEKLKKGGAKK